MAALHLLILQISLYWSTVVPYVGFNARQHALLGLEGASSCAVAACFGLRGRRRPSFSQIQTHHTHHDQGQTGQFERVDGFTEPKYSGDRHRDGTDGGPQCVRYGNVDLGQTHVETHHAW